MKRMILMAAMLFCVLVAGAQDKDGKDVPYRYEVRLGWSGYPVGDDNQFVGVNNHGFYSYDTSISDIFSEYDGTTYMTGNIVGEFNVHFKKWFTLSVGFAANGIWKDVYSSQTDIKLRRENGWTATVLPQARFNWIKKEVVKVYSSVGAGVRAGSFDERADILIAGQLVPIGINVGKKVFGFAELGIGTVYIGGMFGIGYRF
ncbi:MAG: hypothetical protein IKY95_04960 [Bacteroidales bacterium]|nr:hypothetical protein [Bacteroidales bacterium]